MPEEYQRRRGVLSLSEAYVPQQLLAEFGTSVRNDEQVLMTMSDVMSLQQKIESHGNVWEMLYHAPTGPFEFPVRPEFTNWRDEQRAWGEAAIFQDMSHHMTDVYFEGPDIVRLLSDLGINSFDGFGPMQAKQYVVCNHDGYYIGDAILFCEEPDKVSIVGKPMVANWVKFHAETGDYDVRVEHYERPGPDLSKRRRFRYQVQGPDADKILERVHGGPLPDIPFFKMGRFNIGTHQVTALNHRMSGAPGYEFWGPSEIGQEVFDLLFEAGEPHNLRQIGSRIYPVTAVVSGWVGSIVPAIYTGEEMRAYREWLPAASMEGLHSVGGSLVTGQIEDHYRTPFELGYGFMIDFDHDFIGREALLRFRDGPRRKKVRLVWNQDDVIDIYSSTLGDGPGYKAMETPMANYATAPGDRVMDGDRMVGVSYYPVFSVHDGYWFSLGSIDEDLSRDGQSLSLVWGEPDGGSNKVTVERHKQKTVRVKVDSRATKRN